MNIPYKILDEFAVAPDLHIKAIQTTQSPYWYIQYQTLGGQRRQSLRTTSLKEAQIRARRFAAKLQAGQVPCGRANEATLAKIIALWMEELRQAEAHSPFNTESNS